MRSAFWTAENIAKSRAMKRCRALWRGLAPNRQWELECLVYRLQGFSVAPEEVEGHIRAVLEMTRPWRMSDSQLRRALLRPREKKNSRADRTV